MYAIAGRRVRRGVLVGALVVIGVVAATAAVVAATTSRPRVTAFDGLNCPSTDTRVVTITSDAAGDSSYPTAEEALAAQLRVVPAARVEQFERRDAPGRTEFFGRSGPLTLADVTVTAENGRWKVSDFVACESFDSPPASW